LLDIGAGAGNMPFLGGDDELNKAEIMRKIEQEEIVIIQEEVKVDFDNRQQSPIGFQWHNQHYEVLEVLTMSKDLWENLNYLVLTNKGIFNLILVKDYKQLTISKSKWVLNYKVLEDVKGKNQQLGGNFMLTTVEFKDVVSYHGHFCPELAIGCRVGLIARRELGINRQNCGGFFGISENMSSAIDAVQYLTGCTIGNKNFIAYDHGKHVYYFMKISREQRHQEALRIALTSPVINIQFEPDIEEKIVSGRASRQEINKYRDKINVSVQKVLSLPEDSLFRKTITVLECPAEPFTEKYVNCALCKEIVALNKTKSTEAGPICFLCAYPEKRVNVVIQ
jgi:formylmethanofuran dehydrogenase subunit E